jgi:tetratricopeptide (TPR) repeat protein
MISARAAGVLRGAGIVLATLLAYAPALGGGFVWDDDHHLLKNPVLRENGLFRVWFTGATSNYWPVTWTSYWIEHQLFGLDPRGYHVVNVLLHAGSALLTWRVLLRLGVAGAWPAALVFALHPMNVESAAWIAQRKNVLSLFFFLVALLLFLRDERRRSFAAYASAVLAFVASMLAKGAGATLPVILLLLAWRRGTVTRRDLLRAAPFFAVALALSGVEVAFQYGRVLGPGDVPDASLWERLARAGWCVWFYLWKLVLPLNLSFVYPRWEVDATRALAWIPNLALLGLLVALWSRRGDWGRPALVALLYFVITLAPVLGFLDFFYLRYSLVGDHYAYLAILGPIAWAVCAATLGVRRLAPGGRRIAAAACGALVALLGALTWQSSGRFADSTTLWRDTLARNPGAWLAHVNLGVELRSQGRVAEAIEHHREAVRLAPDAKRRYILAVSLLRGGQTEEALEQLRLAVASAPRRYRARSALAALLARRGEREEALEQLEALAEIAPRRSDVHERLALAYQLVGRDAEAEASYRRALELDPTSTGALTRIARLLSACPGSIRSDRDASTFAERAAALRGGDDPDARSLVAAAYAAEGRFDEAIAAARRALELVDAEAQPALAEQIRGQLDAFSAGRAWCPAHRDRRVSSGAHDLPPSP